MPKHGVVNASKQYVTICIAWLVILICLCNAEFLQGGGIFCSPKSPSAPPKLRLLYECAPLAFIMEAAGGASHSGAGSILDQVISSSEQRSVISLGSKHEVEKSIPSLAF